MAALAGPEFCAALVERALAQGADAAQVTRMTGERFEIEFETWAVTQLRSTSDTGLTITVLRDGKRGSATVNGDDPDAIEAALVTALAAADAGVRDSANDVADALSLPPSRYGPEAPDREAMLDAVLACIAELEHGYPKIRAKNSAYSFTVGETSFANSRGVRQQTRRASYGYGMGFIAKDGRETTSFNGSGSAAFTPFAALLDAGSTRRLLEETLRSLGPQPVPEKFIGDVIVTPDCLGGFIDTLAGALGGYRLMAGTTPYRDCRGTRIADARFSLLNRPGAADFPYGAAFDGYGIPTQDLNIIRDGVLNEFLIDFYIAKKLGMAQTAGASNFIVPSGDRKIDDMIGATRRGILLCRFSGGAPNANLDFSGVAKNSFYIEDGAIRYPLVETMISGNLQELLTGIHAISRENVNFGGSRFPYVAAGGVTISSKR